MQAPAQEGAGVLQSCEAGLATTEATQVRKLLTRLRQWVCRHELGLLLQWQPEEVCIHIGCQKCGLMLGHVHLPATVKKEVLH